MPDQSQTPNPDQDSDFWKLDDQPTSQTDEELDTIIEQPTPNPTPSPEQPAPSKLKSFSKTDKIAIGSVLAVILLLGVGYYAYFLDKYDTSDPRDYLANTPAKGEFASIEEIETAWTKPNNDNVRFGINLVPSATIHLDPDSTTSGTLRVVFYSTEKNTNGTLKSAGDSITLKFKDGKFPNGDSTFLVTGTDGLENLGDFYAYRNQDEKRWTVDVREAPENSSDFKPLAKAPIAPLLSE